MSQIPPLTIYASPSSQPSRSVISFCKLSKIPFTYQEINYLATKDHRSPTFTKINPFQEVPALVNNNFNLWESSAMIPYLADAYNIDNQWYPKDIKIRARINSFLHWHHENIRAPIMNYILAKIVLPRFYKKPELTEEKEKIYKETIVKLLETITWMLKTTGNIARTTELTIADVFLFSEITSGMILQIDLAAYPLIQKWFEKLRKIPEVIEVHQMILDMIGMNPKI